MSVQGRQSPLTATDRAAAFPLAAAEIGALSCGSRPEADTEVSRVNALELRNLDVYTSRIMGIQ